MKPTLQAEMLQLAERCEQATGPDREIDRDIALLLGLYDQPEDLGCFPDPAEAVVSGGGQTYAPPRYTASLDAAMTLLGEGWRLYMIDASIPNRFRVTLKGPPLPSEEGGQLVNLPQFQTGTAKLLQNAICAAALRAKSDPPKEGYSG